MGVRDGCQEVGNYRHAYAAHVRCHGVEDGDGAGWQQRLLKSESILSETCNGREGPLNMMRAARKRSITKLAVSERERERERNKGEEDELREERRHMRIIALCVRHDTMRIIASTTRHSLDIHPLRLRRRRKVTAGSNVTRNQDGGRRASLLCSSVGCQI